MTRINNAQISKIFSSFIPAWRFCFSRMEPLWLGKLFHLRNDEVRDINSSVIWLPFIALMLGFIPGILSGVLSPLLNKFGAGLLYILFAMLILEWYDYMVGTRILANCCVVLTGKMFNRQCNLSETTGNSSGIFVVIAVLAIKALLLSFCFVMGRYLWLAVVFSAMFAFKSEASSKISKRNKLLLRVLFIIVAAIFSIYGSILPLLLSVAVVYGLFLQYGKLNGDGSCDDDNKILGLFLAVLEIAVLFCGAVFIKL